MRNISIYLLLAALTCALYWPARHFGFVNYDDDKYIYENPRVAAGLTPANARWAFQSFEVANYHPLTWISYLLDSTLFGVRPAPFHVENVLLHLLNTLLLFGVLNSATRQKWPAAFVAAIFALHPVHVESVAWVSERKDVLSTAFLLAALWAYLGYAAADRRGQKWILYLGIVFCFACGLLAKPMIVTFPFLLMLLDYWPLRRLIVAGPLVGGETRFRPLNWTADGMEKSPLILLALVSSVVTYTAQKAGGALQGLEQVPMVFRLENVPVSYVRYLSKIICPINLSPYYPYRTDWSLASIAGSWALVIALTIFFLRCAKQRPYLIVGWLWFLGTLVPVIGIIQAGGQSIADRYLYVPLIGPAIMVAWIGEEAARFSRALVIGLAGIVLIAAGVTARHQANYWKDTRTLFDHALIVINGNAVAHVHLGYLDARQGNTAAAAGHYNEAIRLDPTNYVPEFDLGNLLLKDHPEQAIAHYRNAARNDPAIANVQNNWGRALLALHRPGDAYGHFLAAIRLDPNLPDAHANLGWVLMDSGFADLAAQEFKTALRIDPNFTEAKRGLAATVDAGSRH